MKLYNVNGIEIYNLPGHGNSNDLDSAKLSGLNLSFVDLEGFNLSDADMSYAILKGANLYWAILFRANLTEANLADADLRGANLCQAKMVKADLSGSNFGYDKLGVAAKLQGAQLLEAIIEDSNFIGAEYDDFTVFPKDFNPITRGMRMVNF
ncbi:pentapeptide repeat-containing protein [Sphingomonas fuzhouensis]|uniref:pentapeptide repeat-containing protein n=1 Tax=Sphingomonas fuzhouensis TaxID=3106033 RepID=UPI002AFE6782|nr:pentapeptide repeat-containing protein [Sphingomonas sp. SGZ-02]